MHHTFYPAHADYRGEASIEAMRRFHVEDRGFEDIAQHVSIAPDGRIWTGRDWNKTPASVGGVLNRGVFMFEMIGNFDLGHDRLEGRQLPRRSRSSGSSSTPSACRPRHCCSIARCR
ncbi:MAG: peptidoglycan recognition family protein [Hyphomicrobiaceae bacterium]